jgi:hypothetical protein
LFIPGNEILLGDFVIFEEMLEALFLCLYFVAPPLLIRWFEFWFEISFQVNFGFEVVYCWKCVVASSASTSSDLSILSSLGAWIW